MRALVAVCVFSFVLAAVLADDAPTKYTGTVRCYVCNSLNAGQGNCTSSDENELKPYLKTCPKVTEGQLLGRSASSCRKIIQDVHEQEATIRECAYTGEDEIDGKRRIGNKGIILYLYQCFPTDDKPCNSASTVSVFSALVLSAVAFVFGSRL